MAHVTKFYIGEVLESICKELEDVATGGVFPEHRPTATPTQMDDFIVVSIASGLTNRNPWQSGTLRIELYVKNRYTGVAYTTRLDEMLAAVMEKFPIVTSRFSVIKPYIALKGNDGLDFTTWNIQAPLIVNTTDSYVYKDVADDGDETENDN